MSIISNVRGDYSASPYAMWPGEHSFIWIERHGCHTFDTLAIFSFDSLEPCYYRFSQLACQRTDTMDLAVAMQVGIAFKALTRCWRNQAQPSPSSVCLTATQAGDFNKQHERSCTEPHWARKQAALHLQGMGNRMISSKLATVLFSCVLLASCGGGGGGDSGGDNAGSAGTLSVSTNNLTFIANGPSGATPAAQTITGVVNGVSSGTLYITIVGTGPAVASISPVVLTSRTTGQATVSVPAPSSLGVGTYTGVITVRACTSDSTCASGNLSGSPQTINVTYHVAALQSTAASLDYSITNTPVASDFTRQATITGIPAQSWTATTDANWLTVTAAGANAATMTAALDPTVVNGLTNGTYTGSITLTPGSAGPPLLIPVSLAVKRTQISYVSPYVAYTGTSREVIIRGEEFSQITVQNVLFGSTPAQSFTVVSPTEIRATYPPSLPRGRHTVQLQSSFPDVRQLADLVVVDAPAFTAAALPYPDTQDKTANALVYDAERAALGVSVWYPSSGATSLIQFRSTANVWQAPTAKALINNFGLALSGDGTQWIAGTDKAVTHLGAADLATVATVQSPLFGSGTQTIANLAVASDGTVAMFGDVYYGCGASLMLYDVRKQKFTTPGYAPCRGNIGASGDGSRLLIPNRFSNLSSDDVFSLNTATGATTPTGIHLLTGAPPAMDRTGARIVLNRTRVYDGAYNYLGNLPATTDAVTLSPDGARAYAFDRSGLLLTYNIAGAAVSGTFPQVGTGITLAADPGRATTTLYSDAVVEMSITPDGKTVFIAGSKAIVIQPVP